MMFYCHTNYTHPTNNVTHFQSGNWYKGDIRDTYATTNGVKWKLIYVVFEDQGIVMKLSEENINSEFIDAKDYLFTQQEFRNNQINQIV